MNFNLNSLLGSGKLTWALDRNTANLFKSIEKLSSGKRINSASDDPAGMVISKQLQSQIASLSQEIDNISANINRYQTASSTVMQLRDQTIELRQLAVGAANTAYNSDDAQQAYDTAAANIVETYNRTVANATYNGANMLDGSERSLAAVSELADIDLSSAEAAAASIATIDAAAAELDAIQIDLGSTQRYDLKSRQVSLEVTRQNLQAAESSILDTDYAQEYADMVLHMIRTKAVVSLMAHSLISGLNVVSLFDGNRA